MACKNTDFFWLPASCFWQLARRFLQIFADFLSFCPFFHSPFFFQLGTPINRDKLWLFLHNITTFAKPDYLKK
jgi:hypothetical protein